MLCRQCGSPEHFTRDCPEAKKATLVSIVLDRTMGTTEALANLSVNEIMGMYRNQSDDVRMAMTSEIEKCYISENHSNKDNHPISEIMYAKLKYMSDQHDFLKDKIDQSPSHFHINTSIASKNQHTKPVLYNSAETWQKRHCQNRTIIQESVPKMLYYKEKFVSKV